MAHTAVPAQPNLLEQALAYSRAGVPVFPCLPGRKEPLTTHGFHDASVDASQIRAWWTTTPQANLATPTGRPGFDVLDVDVRPTGNGWAALHRAHQAGILDGWTRAIRTPSGGLHLHYPGTDQRNGSLRGQHLDFRGLGGYVLLPPSLIQTNDQARRYELITSRANPGQPLDWAAITHLLAPTPAQGPSTPRPAITGSDPTPWLAAHVARQVEGNRDNALFWAACRAAEAGVPDLTPLVDAGVRTGLSDRQARRTVRSAQDTIARSAARPSPRSQISTPNQSQPPIRSAS